MRVEPFGPGLEVLALEMLERPPPLRLLVTREVHLAVARHDRAVAADHHRRVVPVAVVGELRVPEVEADAEPRRFLEQRTGLVTRHVAFEERQHLVVVEVPAREERGERELGEHHEVGAARGRVAQQREEALDHLGSGLGARDRPHLCGRDGELAAHVVAPASSSITCSSTSAPAASCSSSVCSAGLWLTPPALGTNTMPAGHTRANIWASWPAPDGMRIGRSPLPLRDLLHEFDDRVVEPHRLEPRQRACLDGHALALAQLVAERGERRLGGGEHGVVGVPQVDREHRARGDHVHQVRVQLDATDGRDHRRPELVGQRPHADRDLRGHEPGVVAMVHGRGAGVVRLAGDGELGPRDALHPGDHPDLDPLGLEHRPLLDVQLDEGVRRHRGTR